MKTIPYKKATIKKVDLNDIYNGSSAALRKLDENIIEIIKVEAPITLNLLKARLREAFDLAKISQKALDIIEARIKNFGYKTTNNLYDIVIWPSTGEFKIDYLRISYPRLIYDIPYQELANLVKDINKHGEELYREILKYFGYEVLTKKAKDYLVFVEKKTKQKEKGQLLWEK